jgi:hypothetical protein
MGSPNLVTIETAAHYCQANPHSLSLERMAGLASQCGIAVPCAAHRLGEVTMGKAQIGPWRTRRLSPLDFLFDFTVMAIGTVGWSRPELTARSCDAGVTGDAAREELAVLPVVEPLLADLRIAWLAPSPERDYSEDKPPRSHLEPARGRVRKARGRGVRSAPLANMRVTLAFRRVWFQSKALASGRRRSSP